MVTHRWCTVHTPTHQHSAPSRVEGARCVGGSAPSCVVLPVEHLCSLGAVHPAVALEEPRHTVGRQLELPLGDVVHRPVRDVGTLEEAFQPVRERRHIVVGHLAVASDGVGDGVQPGESVFGSQLAVPAHELVEMFGLHLEGVSRRAPRATVTMMWAMPSRPSRSACCPPRARRSHL